MKILFFYTTILALLAFFPMNAEMRIILTAALTDNCFEFRKNQYIESLNILADYGYPNPYIVEAIRTPGPTFLDEYSTNVFYAISNNPSSINHGANEARTLLEALEHFQFADDDMILKITGRYQLFSDRLIRIVKKNQNNFDAFIMVPHKSDAVIISDDLLKANTRNISRRMLNWKKQGIKITGQSTETTIALQKIYNTIETEEDEFWGRVMDPQRQVITHQSIYCLAIAMKCKYFKEMLRGLNYHKLEQPKDWEALEREMECYIKRKLSEANFNIFYLDRLDIRANIFGSSTWPGHPEVIKFY